MEISNVDNKKNYPVHGGRCVRFAVETKIYFEPQKLSVG